MFSFEACETNRRTFLSTSACQYFNASQPCQLCDRLIHFLPVDRFFGTTIMRATYGFDDVGKNKGLIQAAEAVIVEVGLATTPGRYLVNTFPILRHIPEWFPGAGWKRYMMEVAKSCRKVLDGPFEDTKANMVSVTSGTPDKRLTGVIR